MAWEWAASDPKSPHTYRGSRMDQATVVWKLTLDFQNTVNFIRHLKRSKSVEDGITFEHLVCEIAFLFRESRF
jgi:hypothetical protein